MLSSVAFVLDYLKKKHFEIYILETFIANSKRAMIQPLKYFTPLQIRGYSKTNIKLEYFLCNFLSF